MNNGVQLVVHFEQPTTRRNTGLFTLNWEYEQRAEQACSKWRIVVLDKFFLLGGSKLGRPKFT
jgi:hypothetical protein